MLSVLSVRQLQSQSQLSQEKFVRQMLIALEIVQLAKMGFAQQQ
jgi:hypothetical protein